MSGDFKHFGPTMTRLSRKNTSKAHEIYLSLYQSVSGSEEEQNVYKEYSPDFFDLIIVDECHRGSAREDSAWREILDYFKGAAQIGLTATPKETKDVSNIHYFGDPIYTYSLRQGIDDGFLAPYKVIRVVLDKDAEGYRPVQGSVDKYGNLIDDREYTRSDYERTIVLEKRREIIAKRITEFLKATNRSDKVIVFCEDTEHAEAMRSALSNANSDLTKDNSKYVVRITGNDEYGKAELDNFIDPGSKYPVIATTSELLSTGVDTQTVKLIVIDKGINSIGLFKQMIGRGTRIKAEYGKQFFTIMDFTGATRHFADPEFDGDPVMIYEPTIDEPILPDEEEEHYTEQEGQEGFVNDGEEDYIEDNEFTTEFGEPVDISSDQSHKVKKFYIDNVEVQIINETVKYYEKGKLKTESLKDFTINNIKNEYATLDLFIKEWHSNNKKKELLTELENNGVYLEAVREELGEMTKELDDFDLILFLAYDQKPLTRSERVNNIKKKDFFENYSDTAKKVLNGLLEKYQDEGIVEMENIEILKLDPFRDIGSLTKIMKEFGSKKKYIESIKKLEKELYA